MNPEPSAPNPPVKWEAAPLDWSRTEGHSDQLLAALNVRKKRQRRRRLAAVTGTVALLLVGFVCFSTLDRSDRNLMRVVASKAVVTAPERRTLPDGSIVELKPGAQLTVNFSASSPGVRLVVLTRGEVLFQVEKDPARDFVVIAEGIQFRAVGTAFSVDLRAHSVGMLVTEGRVAVETSDRTGTAAPDPIALVDAGYRVDLPSTPPVTAAVIPASTTEAAEKLAWRVPRLEFNETPLWEAVSLLNQHSGSRISLASADIGRVEISGALRADNIEPLLAVLESNYGIQVVRRAGGEIELRQKR